MHLAAKNNMVAYVQMIQETNLNFVTELKNG